MRALELILIMLFSAIIAALVIIGGSHVLYIFFKLPTILGGIVIMLFLICFAFAIMFIDTNIDD